jgi:ATP adenylyltransferase
METQLDLTENCVFCDLSLSQSSTWIDPEVLVVKDRYPVSEGHRLVIPKAHVASLLELTPNSVGRLFNVAVEVGRSLVDDGADGFNLGVNEGVAAGQSVMHLHIHVIPRRFGDVSDPVGGVRGVIPSKRRY